MATSFRTLPALLACLLVIGMCTPCAMAEEDGWEVLFDGSSTDAFRGWKSDTFPEKGWVIDGDALHIQADSKAGDIVTKKQYASFDLRFEWKVAKGSNSGVIYRCVEHEDVRLSFMSGPEYQILEDENHINGKNPKTTAASLYAHYAPNDKKKLKPVGEWNTGRIVVNGSKVEHWLNGEAVVSYDLDSEEFKKISQGTHYKQWPKFAKEKKGHIAFQDHTDDVWFRNIKIKELPDPNEAQTFDPTATPPAKELEEGFASLFDGTSTEHFRGLKLDDVPEKWVIDDGSLHYIGGGEYTRDLITKKKFTDFDLRWYWKIEKGGNSGVKYRVDENNSYKKIHALGLEYQMIDDVNHADAKNTSNHSTAAIYDLYGCNEKKKVNPAGQWNRSRLVVQGDKVEHYLNGELVASCKIGSDEFNRRLAKSKYKKFEGFGQATPSHIVLQDHWSKVWFRNIRIKQLGE